MECACKFFDCSKIYVSRIHTLQPIKSRKCIKTSKKRMGSLAKNCGKRVDKEPTVYMRNKIEDISKILRYCTWDSAQERLDNLQIKWDSYTINQVLKAHPPMEKAWLFFNWASHIDGFKHDQFTYTTMLDIFGEAGRIESMKFVFLQMQEKGIKIDAVTYTSLMHWLSKDGDVEASCKMWEEMKSKGFSPTIVSYTAFMKVLFDNKRPKEAAQVYMEMLELRMSPNCHTYTVLIEYLAGAGKFNEALEIFCKMQQAGIQPDKALCNIFIQKCSAAGQMYAMDQTLRYMKENRLVLRHRIYVEALHALKAVGKSDDLLQEVNPHLASVGIDGGKCQADSAGFHTQENVDRGILRNLLGRQNFIAIKIVLGELVSKGIVLDSNIISDIIQENCTYYRPSSALMAYEYGITMGINLDSDAYVALVGLFTRINSFQKVLEIVNDMVIAGMTLGTYLSSVLIYKLGCVKMPASAAQIFDSFPSEQNTTTYTALLAAYIQSQEVDKGLEVFMDMKRRGIHAASSTYRVLIVGLEKFGRGDEADIYRKKQKSLWHNYYAPGNVSMEEELSDFLFGRGQAL